MRTSIAAPVAILATLLAGCSGGLTTASLTGSGPSQVAAPSPPPATSTDRVLQVASTSARAVKCGYYFDAAKLKSAFLASEAGSGAAADQIQKIERDYDYTRAAVINQIAKQPEYCSDARTKEIKADLTRHLAGDFSPTAKVRATAGGGWLDGLSEPQTGREVLNPDWIKDPKWANRTKRVEE